MRIAKVDARPDWTLVITTTDGRVGQFDMRPYLSYEAFEELKDFTSNVQHSAVKWTICKRIRHQTMRRNCGRLSSALCCAPPKAPTFGDWRLLSRLVRA
ncbi:MAG: DUF2442 domain-containing protein [Methylobacter sp.]